MEGGNADVGTEWIDIMGKGIQIKSVVTGEGEVANMQTVVSCNLTGYFGDDVDHKKAFEALSDQVFVIGEMDTLPSIELTLRHSHVGDIYWLRSSYKFGYGVLGRPGVSRESLPDIVIVSEGSTVQSKAAPLVAIPPEMDLEYFIEVTGHYSSSAAAAKAIAQRNSAVKPAQAAVAGGIVVKDNEDASVQDESTALADVLADTELRKVCGNRWFSYGDYPKAGKSYSKGIQLAQNFLKEEAAADAEEAKEKDEDGGDSRVTDINEEEEERNAADTAGKAVLLVTLITCMNNLAACHLSMKEYLKAKDVCVRVLEMEPDNQKALIRAAKAALALHEYEECSLCLKLVEQLCPDNPSLAAEQSRLKVARAAYLARDRQMAKNMASKLFPDQKKKTEEEKKVEGKEAVAEGGGLKPGGHKEEVGSSVSTKSSSSSSSVPISGSGSDPVVLGPTSSAAPPEDKSAKEKADEKKVAEVEEKLEDRKGRDLAVECDDSGDKQSERGTRAAVEEVAGAGPLDVSARTPSALLMMVCSALVLVLSVLVALWLR